jgi:septal ring factor EnvC (AmiA/AmiB activator)
MAKNHEGVWKTIGLVAITALLSCGATYMTTSSATAAQNAVQDERIRSNTRNITDLTTQVRELVKSNAELVATLKREKGR